MSTITQVADAIASALNDGAFSQEFTAQRLYQPSFELADLETLRVSVVPKSVTVTNASRTHAFLDCAIDIGVQKKLSPGSESETDAEIDALLALAEEIADHLRQKRLEAMPEAAWLSLEHEPIFAPEHLDQHRQFTSVLTVTYRVRK
ncbi:MAG TPA: hypothetical protein PK098_06670 [Phycisphaerales bacterium]|nr:hypothetical protein [Phycisphaerales bacterium]